LHLLGSNLEFQGGVKSSSPNEPDLTWRTRKLRFRRARKPKMRPPVQPAAILILWFIYSWYGHWYEHRFMHGFKEHNGSC